MSLLRIKTKKLLFALIEKLNENRFYGCLEIQFEAGKIVSCKKTESL